MSRYLSCFKQPGDYALDASTLEYPHVSLIEETGEIKYISFKLQELHDAPYLSKVLYNTNSEKVIWVRNDEYNTTDYPTDVYISFAKCIYDAASRDDNTAVFMLNSQLYARLLNSEYWTSEIVRYTKDGNTYTSTYSTQEINHYFWDLFDDSTTTFDLRTNIVSSQYLNYIITNGSSCAAAKNSISYGLSKGQLFIPTIRDVKVDLGSGVTTVLMNFNSRGNQYLVINNGNIYENFSDNNNLSIGLVFYAGPEFN